MEYNLDEESKARIVLADEFPGLMSAMGMFDFDIKPIEDLELARQARDCPIPMFPVLNVSGRAAVIHGFVVHMKEEKHNA